MMHNLMLIARHVLVLISTCNKMGGQNTSLMKECSDSLSKLDGAEQERIITKFRTATAGKKRKVDRVMFADLLKEFDIPSSSCVRLFDAFDRKNTGYIDLEEFVCGLAVVLHGSFQDKCQLLFRMFNLDGDEGVSMEELKVVLLNMIRSSSNVMESGTTLEEQVVIVKEIVDEAFDKCDISHTGTLLPREFEYWVRENPGVVKPLFGWLLLPPSNSSTEDGSGMEESLQSSLSSTAEAVDAAPKFLCSDVNVSEESLSEVEATIWLPSRKVKSCLLSGLPPSSALLSQPVVKHHRFQGKAVNDAGLTQSWERVVGEIQGLVDNGDYSGALSLIGEILMTCGTSVTPQTLQLWSCRLALMCFLGMYDGASSELEGFGDLDKVDLSYEYYPGKYAYSKGSLVPFSMRLLHAQLPLWTVDPNLPLAVDRIYSLKSTVLKICAMLDALKGEELGLPPSRVQSAKDLWQERLFQTSLVAAGCFVMQQDYALAIAELQECIKLKPTHLAPLLNYLGRVNLALGDIRSAEGCFRRGEEAGRWGQGGEAHGNIHECFVPLYAGRTDEALSKAEECLKPRPTDPLAVNNYAVCLFHARRPKETVKHLEVYVTRVKAQRGMLDNLSRAYELETLRSEERRQKLQRQIVGN